MLPVLLSESIVFRVDVGIHLVSDHAMAYYLDVARKEEGSALRAEHPLPSTLRVPILLGYPLPSLLRMPSLFPSEQGSENISIKIAEGVAGYRRMLVHTCDQIRSRGIFKMESDQMCAISLLI